MDIAVSQTGIDDEMQAAQMHVHVAAITFARSARLASSVWTPCSRSLTQDTASASSAGCASSNPYAFANAQR